MRFPFLTDKLQVFKIRIKKGEFRIGDVISEFSNATKNRKKTVNVFVLWTDWPDG
ncbi:hypothetical protein LEP1GSC179_2131 [Leptospira santarosai str. MOR084]|uniref:Uncharacterized protein n=1 Tax=Leptospira santarosai str. MOR084 TaxID=1049984 RepID=A0A0E2BG40_9LEPT|nr:hypothetical protein LEP1GSC179_2131 [Leptospira santarosai str. MOR084]